MQHLLHFSLRCPRCHRNRSFSIKKDYKDSHSLILECQGFEGKCKYTASLSLNKNDYPDSKFKGER